MKTPIQELLIHLNPTLKDLLLKEFTKREKEFAHKCFIAGENYGIDVNASIEWGENPTEDDFGTFYKQFEE